MNTLLSRRVQSIKPSPTLVLAAQANRLKAEGKDIINLTTGEPDFDTPEHIKEAARKALKDGITKYTAVDGMPALKKAIIKKFSTENHLNFEPNEVMVSTGCKQCFYNMAQALLNPGDEVIIPAPYWVSYPDMVLLAEGTPVFIDTTLQQHFKISAEQLTHAITPKTRMLVLNSPSNPSGMTYNRTQLTALANVLLKHPHILIATDDIYEHIYWNKEPFANILNVCPELKDRVIVLNGVSKAYAMTGWRIGYAAANKTIISAMSSIQSQSTSNANSIAQVAAAAALEGDQQCVRDMNQAYHRRHDYFYGELKKLPGVDVLPADGTFYSFPSFEKWIAQQTQIKSDQALAELLLHQADLAVVPGSAFGTPNCLRFSYATSDENLQKAIARLKKIIV